MIHIALIGVSLLRIHQLLVYCIIKGAAGPFMENKKPSFDSSFSVFHIIVPVQNLCITKIISD